MKRIPLNALAKALYKRLTEHQDIPVYDDVTVEAKAPYITMGLLRVKTREQKSTTYATRLFLLISGRTIQEEKKSTLSQMTLSH